MLPKLHHNYQTKVSKKSSINKNFIIVFYQKKNEKEIFPANGSEET